MVSGAKGSIPGAKHTGKKDICTTHMGVSENRGPQYSTLNGRIPYYKVPKIRYPYFRKLPYMPINLVAEFISPKKSTISVL